MRFPGMVTITAFCGDQKVPLAFLYKHHLCPKNERKRKMNMYFHCYFKNDGSTHYILS